MQRTRDLRVASLRPLLSPAILREEIPMTDRSVATVTEGRAAIARILSGQDDRLVVVVGPCSIHDPLAAVEYGERLARVRARHAADLCVVMRVYFEKPRTTVGWKGLINDPRLDGSYQINEGLRVARRLLRDLNELGLPCGTEFLDPFTPQFMSGLVSWGAIGARTTESQTHRELASGLSMPIGFKNGTYGTVQIAVDAIMSSAHPHHFLGVTDDGIAGIVRTTGNRDCHLILRGGKAGPNYDAESVAGAAAALKANHLRPCVMVDCSHGNSKKDPAQQPLVVQALAEQISSGQYYLMGAMLESFLVEGTQPMAAPEAMTYGQSVTDACMSWETTEPALDELAHAVRDRRKHRRGSLAPPAS